MPSYQDLQREEAIKERFGKKSTYSVYATVCSALGLLCAPPCGCSAGAGELRGGAGDDGAGESV